METIIKQHIADFHESLLPQITPRYTKMPFLPNKIDTVIGMRRTGKTWFVFQKISELLAQGQPKDAVLYLNMEDERLLPLTYQELHMIPETYYRLFPNNRNRICYFFFDEIQNITGWENFIRRLFDTENIHICITGSSAKLLSLEIATCLRGRSLSTEIFPFSFAEFLDHHNILYNSSELTGKKQRSLMENQFNTYLIQGGFPEIQGIEKLYQIRILQEYTNVVILRDVVERHKISDTLPLRYLSRHLINNSASLFSVNKFYNDIKSQGISCGKNSLHTYLDFLFDSYLFFQANIHTDSERQRMVNPRKIYTIDTGLILACSKSKIDWGRFLENYVYIELRRKTGNTIEYYKTRKGNEVDFIVTDIYGNISLYQVSVRIDENATRERELKALTEAMEELNIDKGIVITLNHEENIKNDFGNIYVIPAWHWALSNIVK